MEKVQVCLQFLDFAAAYGIMKCMKTVLAGMLGMCVILPSRRFGQNADRKLYAMLLLLPLAFTGTSKLFFLPWTIRITAVLMVCLKPIFGKIYFAVCAVLLLRLLWKHRRMGKWVRSLPVTMEAGLQEGIGCVAPLDGCPPWGRLWRRLQRRYLSRVRVHVTEENISPFAGGILRPYIVMPGEILRDWRPERRRMILCHELIHIRSGHMLWLALFRLLKIYWWVNPAVYLCHRLLSEDMELVCDEQCVACTGASPADYGRTMVDMLGLMQTGRLEGSPAFIRYGRKPRDFEELKGRLDRLAQTGDAGEVLCLHRKWGVRFAVAAAALTAAVILTAYPRYTKMTELVLFDEQFNVIDYDSKALREAAQVQDGRIILDRERFGALMAKKEVPGEYVYLSFDTILKMPGYGGGGNTGMISTKDCGDIFYLAADCVENRVMVFCLKYLL